MSAYNKSMSYERLSKEGKERLDYLAACVSRAFGIEISDCFASEVVDGEGKVSYSNFIFFSEHGITECSSPMVRENFDIAPLKKRVCAVDIESASFDFNRPTQASRLTAEVWLGATGPGGWYLTLRAAGEGCVELGRIMKDWIVPNLAQSS